MTVHPCRHRSTAPRGGIAVVLAVALGVAGCGGETAEPVVDPPVVQAEQVPFDGSGLAPPSASDPAEVLAEPADEATPAGDEPSPSPSATTTIGPSSADAAAFVRSDALADLVGIEHVVVDLDADTWPEVVATGIRDRVGVLRVAWWTAAGYEVLTEDVGGPGRDVTDLRAADVNADGRTELLVEVHGDGLGSLAVWRVPRRGELERLAAVGGCHDGSHVYGVTRAWLESGGEGPPAIVADCDESPLPVADWGEQRWEWQDGAYRVVTSPSPPAQAEGDPGGGDGKESPGRDQPGEGGQGGGQGSGGDGD